jgi:hypothetical protein
VAIMTVVDGKAKKIRYDGSEFAVTEEPAAFSTST